MSRAPRRLPSLQWPGDNRRSQDASPPAREGARTLILDYVNSHPGVHLRQICRELGLAMGDVQYNVQRLEKEGLIVSVRRSFYRFFYPSTLFGPRERDLLGVLTLETPRELLLAIIGRPGSSQDELSKLVGISQPTASWHLKRLCDLGVVEKKHAGRTATYSAKGTDPSEVASFIRSYHPTVWDRWSGRFADIFISYSREEPGAGQ